MLRILAFFILLLSILFMPFWISAILAFLGMIYFSFFLEAIFLLFISDLLLGTGEIRFFHAVIISMIGAILALVIIEFLKKKLKFYPK